MKGFILVLSLLFCSFKALAHKPSDSYLALEIEERRVHGQWDIALRDLDFSIGLDGNDDGNITWRELREREQAVHSYALSRLSIRQNNQDCPLNPEKTMVDEHSDGHYAVLKFQALCADKPEQLAIAYRLFFDLDPQHRGLLRLINNSVAKTALFSPDRNSFEIALNSEPKVWQELLSFGYEGVWHIWIGYDHILFLLSLLLPASLIRDGNIWRAKSSVSKAFWDAFGVVTAFTLAHSITLSMSALGYIALPSRFVESAIAASVALAALNNIYPVFINRRTWFAFSFGLIHGMGIASVLLDMGLPDQQRILSLLGFNLGVEFGQLAIVTMAFPLITLLSQYRYYSDLVIKGCSASIVIIALIWLAERSLNFQIDIF